MTQDLIYNVASQAIYYDPPEGQPTGVPTCTVFLATNDDDGTFAVATTGACSVDAVSTTFSASIGDTEITVADGTGITRGRRYLIESPSGEREWTEIKSRTGLTVGLRYPLKNTFAAGSTFKGCRISISVLDSWAASRSNISDILDPSSRDSESPTIAGAAGYRVRWAYTVASVATIGVSFFDLVRYQAKNIVTPLDVDRRFPGWIDRLSTDYQEDQGQSLIDEAFAAIKMDALGDDQVIRRIRSTEVIRELTIYRASMLAQEAALFAGGTNAEQVKAAEDLYEARYKLLVREPKVPVDQTGGGASAPAQRLAAWRR